MIYGVNMPKHGEIKTGYIRFDTGKRVFLNKKERIELKNKIREWQMIKRLG